MSASFFIMYHWRPLCQLYRYCSTYPYLKRHKPRAWKWVCTENRVNV